MGTDAKSALPFVTVVVPALNEASTIAAHLESLLGQTYPRDRYEVVLVDNGSTDDTAAIAARFPVRILHESVRSAYVARNKAIRDSEGEYLAFTDADCIALPNWLESLVAAAQKTGALLVAGQIDYKLKHDNLANQFMLLRYSPETRRMNIERFHCAPTGNLLVGRALFDRFGTFDPLATASDDEFSKRMAANGYPPLFASDAVVVHMCDLRNSEYLLRSFHLRFGQAYFDARKNRLGGWAVVRSLPWRPGVRRARELARLFSARRSYGVLSVLVYAWMDRFCAYLGGVAGVVGAHLKRRT